MQKTRFLIELPGGKQMGFDKADAVLDALNDLADAKGAKVSDQQTGMKDLGREALVALANAERE